MRRLSCWLLACAVSVTACHPGPVLNTGPKQTSVGGTIAGIVTTAEPMVAVPSRKVTATETTTGSRYDAITAATRSRYLKGPTASRWNSALVKRSRSNRIQHASTTAISIQDATSYYGEASLARNCVR